MIAGGCLQWNEAFKEGINVEKEEEEIGRIKAKRKEFDDTNLPEDYNLFDPYDYYTPPEAGEQDTDSTVGVNYSICSSIPCSLIDDLEEIEERRGLFLDMNQPNPILRSLGEGILNEEQSKYTEKVKRKALKQNIDYLEHHPEVEAIISVILNSVLLERPFNPLKYIKGFVFKELRRKVKQYLIKKHKWPLEEQPPEEMEAATSTKDKVMVRLDTRTVIAMDTKRLEKVINAVPNLNIGIITLPKKKMKKLRVVSENLVTKKVTRRERTGTLSVKRYPKRFKGPALNFDPPPFPATPEKLHKGKKLVHKKGSSAGSERHSVVEERRKVSMSDRRKKCLEKNRETGDHPPSLMSLNTSDLCSSIELTESEGLCFTGPSGAGKEIEQKWDFQGVGETLHENNWESPYRPFRSFAKGSYWKHVSFGAKSHPPQSGLPPSDTRK